MPPSALAKPSQSLLYGPDGRRLPLSETVRRTDAWENQVTGFGTRRDKTTHGQFLANYVLAVEQLSALYHHGDMPRRVVDLLPTEALREPFEVDVGDEALNEAVPSTTGPPSAPRAGRTTTPSLATSTGLSAPSSSRAPAGPRTPCTTAAPRT